MQGKVQVVLFSFTFSIRFVTIQSVYCKPTDSHSCIRFITVL